MREAVIRWLLFGCALVSIGTTLGIIYILVSEAVFGVDNVAFFQRVSPVEFFTQTDWTPGENDESWGVLPLLWGTVMIAGIAALIGLPVGLLSAVYLSEYASTRLRAWVKPCLEILAGIPTVVYGYFAYIFVTPYLLRGPLQDWLGLFQIDSMNAMSAGIVVGIMIIPMVSSLSEDALRAVPSSLREAGYALGSTKFDVSTKIVLPAAISGIVASFILAISRAIGETMAVTLAAGATVQLTANPFREVQTMTSFIVKKTSGDVEFGSLEYQSIYAVALTLFVITLLMNILSQIITRRFREAYQ